MAQDAKGRPASIWTPANVVTCVRIVFIPVFMVVAAAAYDTSTGTFALAPVLVSSILYIVLSLTDKLDGHLARSRDEVTDFGKFLDPIADKLLVFSALLLLLEQGFTNVWFVFVILLREFLVSAVRMVAGAEGHVIAADGLGKAKTAVTMVSLCTFYVAFTVVALDAHLLGSVLLWAAQALLAVAVLLTVISGVHYIWNARHIVFRA